MPEKTLPTQKFVNIREIKNGVVYLKNGTLRKVLIVGGVNFDLKSEPEQGLILGGFQDFLNTLDFSVQFFIHSRKINVSAYLEAMEERKNKEESGLLKVQIEDYINFIKSFVEENAIISKSFFVVIPYDPISIAKEAGGILSVLGLGNKKRGVGAEAERETNYREQLGHRVDQTIHGLAGIGLRAVPLEDEELIELFYNLYNPQLVEKHKKTTTDLL